MKNFYILSILPYEGLFRWGSSRLGHMSHLFISPILTILLFLYLGRFNGDEDATRFYIVGVAVLSMPSVVLGGMFQCFYYDHAGATLPAVLATPVSRLRLYLSRGISHLPNGLIVVSSGVAVSSILAGFILEINIVVVSFAVLAVTFSVTAFSLVFAPTVILMREWLSLRSIGAGFLLLSTGAVIPIDSFPSPINVLVRGLPVTNGLEALRHGIMGSGISEAAMLLIAEMSIGLVYLLIGYWVFLRFISYASHTGVLYADVD